MELGKYPIIDGKIDVTVDGSAEYYGWAKLPMYDAGKNIGDRGINERGEAAIAYFCPYKRLCVAAYATNTDTIDEADANNWLKIGQNQPNFKLQSQPSGGYQAIDYQFIRREDGKAIGWEACWTVEPSVIAGKSLEVHYNNQNAETRSTGREGKNGDLCELLLDCDDPQDKCDDVNDCDLVDNDCTAYTCDENGLCVMDTDMTLQPDGTPCGLNGSGCCVNGECSTSPTACDDGGTVSKLCMEHVSCCSNVMLTEC